MVIARQVNVGGVIGWIFVVACLLSSVQSQEVAAEANPQQQDPIALLEKSDKSFFDVRTEADALWAKDEKLRPRLVSLVARKNLAPNIFIGVGSVLAIGEGEGDGEREAAFGRVARVGAFPTEVAFGDEVEAGDFAGLGFDVAEELRLEGAFVVGGLQLHGGAELAVAEGAFEFFDFVVAPYRRFAARVVHEMKTREAFEQ